MDYTEHFYKSNDELDLYYRTYGSNDTRLPIVCLSGLTRNSQDFDGFAKHFCDRWKIYTLDYRGRGKSDWDPDYKNYDPQTYLADIMTFLTSQKIERAIFLGTSLGGLLSIGLAGLAPNFVEAVILNDVGPEVASDGSARIAGYVGNDVRFDTLEAVAAAQKEMYQNAYPDVDEGYWIETAKVGFVYDETDKNYRASYDLGLGKAMIEQLGNSAPIDLWPFFEMLKSKPVLTIRGGLSDVLSEETFERMKSTLPHMAHLTLPNRGHVPTLTEPASIQSIDQFLTEL